MTYTRCQLYPMRRWTKGFSLVEVLITISIFAIGVVAVASIVPTATYLQKQTVQDVTIHGLSHNIKAFLKGRPFTYRNGGVLDLNGTDSEATFHKDHVGAGIYDYSSVGDHVADHVALSVAVPLPGYVYGYLTVNDRSYPAVAEDPSNRDFYWIPLVQDVNGDPENPDWRVYVFVLQGGGQYDLSTQYNGHEIISESNRANPASDISNYTDDEDYSFFPPVPHDMFSPIPHVVSIELDDPEDSVGGLRFDFDNRHDSDTPKDDPDQVRIGDQILDSNGVIYQVTDADSDGVIVDSIIRDVPHWPNRIWYGRPASRVDPSPTRQILMVTDGVLK